MPKQQAELGSFENPVKFKDQDYLSLRKACLESATLFSDSAFPADQKAIGMPVDPDPAKAIRWLRPKEIFDDALFVVGTTGTTDICQGQLGNCWLLAAMSCLTMHPKLFAKVVPPGQSLAEPHAGIFHFKFWQYGEWVEVVVDDKLPVRGGLLLFGYSCTRNEFWSALLEKAYAKLIGSYSSLKGGNVAEGMEDFTGGIAYSLPVSSRTPAVLWRNLSAALSRRTLLSCFIQASTVREVGTVTGEGLVKGHAYAITDTDVVKKASGKVSLLKLRNPWGYVEYTGPWSDKSDDWKDVDSAEKARIELKKREDGEFWISAGDFRRLYDTVELCSTSPDTPGEGLPSSASDWTISSHKASWVPGVSAGGSRRYRRSFWKNPQFQLVLTEDDQDQEDSEDDEDDDDDDSDADEGSTAKEEKKAKVKRCTVLVELLQKNRRQKDKVNFLYIAFHIYRVPPELQGLCLDQNFFTGRKPVGRSGKYQPRRGVWRKVKLDPGHYVVVASVYRPNKQGEFFLRIFSKTGNTLGSQDFTCSSEFLTTVYSKPPLPEDRVRVQNTFDEVAGSDDRVHAKELMELLNSVLEKDYQLPLETCRQLIFGEDTQGRGTLSREQTESLVTSMRTLESIFFKFDEDSSGTMSPFELNLALQAAGAQCDGQVLQLLWERFGSGELRLPFRGFVSCVTRLRKLFGLYESESSQEVKDRGINTWLLQFLSL